jgi:hypothetical protein
MRNQLKCASRSHLKARAGNRPPIRIDTDNAERLALGTLFALARRIPNQLTLMAGPLNLQRLLLWLTAARQRLRSTKLLPPKHEKQGHNYRRQNNDYYSNSFGQHISLISKDERELF